MPDERYLQGTPRTIVTVGLLHFAAMLPLGLLGSIVAPPGILSSGAQYFVYKSMTVIFFLMTFPMAPYFDWYNLGYIYPAVPPMFMPLNSALWACIVVGIWKSSGVRLRPLRPEPSASTSKWTDMAALMSVFRIAFLHAGLSFAAWMFVVAASLDADDSAIIGALSAAMRLPLCPFVFSQASLDMEQNSPRVICQLIILNSLCAAIIVRALLIGAKSVQRTEASS